jgi:hypothetical protein
VTADFDDSRFGDRSFDELVDVSDLGPHEQARLLRMHDMLVAAGPPSELPGALAEAPTVPAVDEAQANVIPFSSRRRVGAVMLIAATVAAACFGGGYVLANQTHSSAARVFRTVELQGQQNSLQQNSEAALEVGAADANGNWPMQLTVSGLKPLSSAARYYLMVWQDGKPAGFCGTFEVSATGSTRVTFNVAYKITKTTKWVVTKIAPGIKFPGDVVMTTA